MKHTYPSYSINEDDLLDIIVIKDKFSQLPKKQQVTLGLSLLGYTQGVLANILNISRTSVGILQKQAITTIFDSLTVK